MPLHCPRCNKNIDKDKVEDISKKLMNDFQNYSLTQGRCPVCGTPLIDTERKVTN